MYRFLKELINTVGLSAGIKMLADNASAKEQLMKDLAITKAVEFVVENAKEAAKTTKKTTKKAE